MGKKEKTIDAYIYILVFLALSLFLAYYLHISVGKLPMMDYWLGIDNYIEDVMTGSIDINTFISIPHSLQWNPFYKLVNYIFVRCFSCDNRAYVYGGMIFSLLSIILLIFIYKKNLSSDKVYLNAIGVTVCTLPIVNLNQWEIYTLFCNFTFMARIFTYLLLIYFLEKILRNNNEIRIIRLLCFSIVNLGVILFMSQAYFLGLAAAEIAILAVDFIMYNNKYKIKYYFIIFISDLMGTVIYYITLDKSDISADLIASTASIVLAVPTALIAPAAPTASTIAIASAGVQTELPERIMDYIQGIFIMSGSAVIPQTVSLNHLSICCGIGLIIFLMAIAAVYLFFKTNMYKETYFPLACLIYAFASIVVIAHGRLYTFGVESLTSSRYVVETTIGLAGLIQIYWYCFCKANIEIKLRILIIPVLIGIVGMLFWSNRVELGIGPHRKIYNNNMIRLAYDIENVPDEELAVFQAPPDRVREGLRIMKKYNLCIYNE